MILEISVVIFLFMLIVFLFSLIRSDNSVSDIGWCTGIILVSIFSLFQGGTMDLPKIVMNFFVLVWGARLSIYIYLRNKGKPEDFRYKTMRETWKYFTLRSFFQIYLFQGFILFLIAMPIWVFNFSAKSGFDLFDMVGAVIFLTGFYFEMMADAQVDRFRKDPTNKDKLLTSGLWSISRHPNYFGEALIWWGISLFAVNVSGGWITLISPVLMTVILRYITGVPPMEKRMEGRPGWDAYKNDTPVFVPKNLIVHHSH